MHFPLDDAREVHKVWRVTHAMSTKDQTPDASKTRKTEPVNVTMPKDVKRMAKSLCKARRRSRSGLIADLIVEAYGKL